MMNIAEVAVAAPLDKTLSYAIPEELKNTAVPGVRVRVPLGRRTATGYLLGVSSGETEKLKPIREILDIEPLFTPAWVDFLKKAAAYYRFPIGEVFRCALPAGLSGKGNDVSILSEKIYSVGDCGIDPAGKKQKQILRLVQDRGEISLSELRLLVDTPHGHSFLLSTSRPPVVHQGTPRPCEAKAPETLEIQGASHDIRGF